MNSTKVVIGYFPKKICYVYAKPREVNVGCEWDMDYGAASQTKKETVLPAFPADDSDSSHVSTALIWAKNQNMMGLSLEERKTIPPPDIEVITNNSIKGVRILSVEQRGNGGRAYKALVGKYYIDVREDVVMDTMLQVGVAANGVLQGEFIWAKIGSQMKLVRKGSNLYDLITDFSAKRNLKPIPRKELKVGGVYQTRKKETYLFLGFVNTTEYKSDDKEIQKMLHSLNFDPNSEGNFSYQSHVRKNQMLFYKLYKHETYEKGIEDLFTGEYYRFNFKPSHSFIEKIDDITLDADVIEKASSAVLKSIKEKILNYLGKIPPNNGHYKLTKRDLQDNINCASETLNMYLVGSPKKELFDLKKYLLFS